MKRVRTVARGALVLLCAWTAELGAQSVFLIPLEGSQEVPAVTTSATGVCTGVLSEDQTEFKVICRHTVADVTAAHIHKAPAGVSGDVLIPFDSPQSPMLLTVSVSAEFLQDLLAGDLYVNVHSPTNPGGEIRGQILDPSLRSVTFPLEPGQEVPAVQSTATGECAAVLNADRTELTVSCTHDVSEPTASHIHKALRGVSAGVVVPFESGKSPIIHVASIPTLLGDLIGEGLYVNVHSPSFPGGELRGQIPNPFRTLYFSQFGNGGGLTSDIVMVNPSDTETVSGQIDFTDAGGAALGLGLRQPEQTTASSVSFSIAPLGSLTVSTDGAGELSDGSTRVTADRDLGGFIRFSIANVGVVGVSESAPASAVIVPVRRIPLPSGSVNTGIAVRNTANQEINVTFTLRGTDGRSVANGSRTLSLSARGRISQFFHDLFPLASTENFEGNLVVETDIGKIAAIALEFVGGQAGAVTALPVTPLEE